MVPKRQGEGRRTEGDGSHGKQGREKKAARGSRRQKGKHGRSAATHKARERAGPVIDPDLAVVIKDPLRVQILAIAIRRPISPSEFAKQSGCPLGTAAYHFKVLFLHGFLEMSEQVQVRGATKHMYRATKSGYISDNDWGQIAQAVRPGIAGAALQDFNARVIEAIESGTFYTRDDSYLLWAPIKLDEISWPKFVEMMAWAYSEAKELEVETINRNAKGEGEGRISATFAIAGFESPKDSGRRTGAGGRKSPKNPRPKKSHE